MHTTRKGDGECNEKPYEERRKCHLLDIQLECREQLHL